MKLRGSIKVVALFALFMLLAPIQTTTVLAKEETVHTGVFIDQLDISGMDEKKASEELDKYVEDLGKKKISLSTSKGNVAVELKDLKLNYQNKDVIQSAMLYGRSGNVLKRYTESKNLEKNAVVMPLEKTFDEKALQKVLKNNSSKLVDRAKNATLKRKSGKFIVVPEVIGVTLDQEASEKALATYLNDTWDGNDCEFDLTVITEEPKYVSKDLESVTDQLATFTTNYSSSSNDRSANIANGAKLINGTVVYPGEEFSTYDLVAPFTRANGYFIGKAYSNGQVIDSIGGGICQVSSTLYNTAIRAELDITDRMPHSMNVAYVPLAADAAIAGTYKNLKFKNNTNYPIYIQGFSENRNVTFTIYGKEERDSNRKIKFRSKQLATYYPGADIATKDPTMAEGRTVVTQSAHIGYKAELWKDIYIDGKKVDSILMNTSVYQASPRRVIIGTKKKVEPPKEKPEATTEAPNTATTAPEKPTEKPVAPPTTEAPVSDE